MKTLVGSAVVSLLLLLVTLYSTPAANADPDSQPGCTAGADLQFAGEICVIPGTQAQQMVRDAAQTKHRYSFEPNCHDGTAKCSEAPTCTAEDGTQGEDMIMYQDSKQIGETCWTGTTEPQEPTPDQVMTAARRLAWPQAALLIQPPQGETLVNFDTNFYTTTTAPATQSTPLLDVTVTIEATPTTYTWSFGDGSSRASHDPGAAYPDLRITHRYLRKGLIQAQVDVTYTGRYRFDDGDWQPLPDTLTVAGTPQQLRVLTATPHLVGN
jgi:hypothetical protein